MSNIFWKLYIGRFILYNWGLGTLYVHPVTRQIFVTLWFATGSINWSLFLFKLCCILLIDYFSDGVSINFCETNDKLIYANQDIKESVMTFKEWHWKALQSLYFVLANCFWESQSWEPAESEIGVKLTKSRLLAVTELTSPFRPFKFEITLDDLKQDQTGLDRSWVDPWFRFTVSRGQMEGQEGPRGSRGTHSGSHWVKGYSYRVPGGQGVGLLGPRGSRGRPMGPKGSRDRPTGSQGWRGRPTGSLGVKG